MKCILVAAISRDGYIADINNRVDSWVSNEDKNFFKQIRDQHSFFVMGRGTYDAVQPKPSDKTLRIVLCSDPSIYLGEKVPNQLEFHNLSPVELVNEYKDIYESCLILGGSKVYTDFLKLNLIDEIFLTVEPVKLSEGTPFLKALDITDLNLPKPTESILNNEGTLLRHYVLKK